MRRSQWVAVIGLALIGSEPRAAATKLDLHSTLPVPRNGERGVGALPSGYSARRKYYDRNVDTACRTR
jgi:hypothetical protein